MLHQQSDRQAALHLELRVEAFLCLLQDFDRQVGGDDLDAPAGQPRAVLLPHHCPGISLLHALPRGAPDAALLTAVAPLHTLTHHAFLELPERPPIAERTPY